MLMSHAAISAVVMGLPRFGVCAKTALEVKTSVMPAIYFPSLCVDMFHLSTPFDRPTRDGVVVLVGESGNCRDSRRLAAHGDKLGASRLHVSGFIPRPALQDGGSAIPTPGDAESRECFAEHGLLQRCLRPRLASV